MAVVNILLLILCMILIPLGIGFLFTKFLRDSKSLGLAVVCGYASVFALSELLIIPMIYLQLPLHLLVVIWSVSLGGLAIVGYMLNIKNLMVMGQEYLLGTKKVPPIMWVAVALILLQVAVLVFLTHFDADDAFYLATATTAVQTDTVFSINPYTGVAYDVLPSRYVLSPFPIYIALVSYSAGMHPATFAHTVLPMFFIPLAYIVYYQIGKVLFKENKVQIGWFLVFACVFNIFGNYTAYTQSTFMLLRIWQGKAVLAAIIVPAIFYACMQVMKNNEKTMGWILLLALNTAACFISGMGIMFAAVMSGSFAILFGLFGKKWDYLWKTLLCCIPNIILSVVYIFIR
ncbi:MAG: DUF6077 domain-containing protein [Lachnospiraceae bacterium]